MFQAFNRIAAIATKELIHMVRDRLSFLTEARLETPAGCTAPPGTPVGVRVAGVVAKAS